MYFIPEALLYQVNRITYCNGTNRSWNSAKSTRENGTGIWAAIDEDVYNDPQHLKEIVKILYKNLPIIPCYSKSGGLHLYFFDEPFTYDEIKKVLLYYKKILTAELKSYFQSNQRNQANQVTEFTYPIDLVF